MNTVYDMLIVGGGPGGYTAALYGARAGMSVLVLEKLSAGGQMVETPQIDNYPGIPEGIDGFTMGQNMQKGAGQFGAKTQFATVLRLSLEGEIKTVETDAGNFYGKTVVIATGAEPKKLGIPEETAYIGRGIHYCAACDGMFYRGKTVAVVGGGNTAVADALIHRRDSLRASKVYHKAQQEQKNLQILWNSRVAAFQSGELTVEDTITGKTQEISCDGVFVAIGRKPATELVKGSLRLDEQGYILADESTKTNIPGVFAVGDVRTKQVRQIVTAVADGAAAAYMAEEYLASAESE